MNANVSHSPRCVENAEISVRENCASQLTAQAWDRDALAAQNAWVTAWATEWLNDGTSSCVCQ